MLFTVAHFLKKRPPFPSYLVGQLVQIKKPRFQITGQGLSVWCRFCDTPSFKSPVGAWLKLKVVGKDGEDFLVSDSEPLPLAVSSSSTLPYEEIKNWSKFIKTIHEFFEDEGCLHVNTRHLVTSPGTEPYIEAFSVKDKFLAPSPEMHLKALLCKGMTDIFEITTCFRDEHESLIHAKEFHMLEWYRSLFSLDDMINNLENLLKKVSQLSFFKGQLAPLKVVSVQDLFKEYLDFHLTPQTKLCELVDLIKKHNLYNEGPACSFEEAFHLLFLNKIEACLDKETPYIIRDYPPSLRAYSQINASLWADRFELFWRGFELANAFYEVTDSDEMLSLFKENLKEKSQKVPYDKHLIELMKKKSMLPVSGIALGLDRLFAACLQKKDIWFFKA